MMYCGLDKYICKYESVHITANTHLMNRKIYYDYHTTLIYKAQYKTAVFHISAPGSRKNNYQLKLNKKTR